MGKRQFRQSTLKIVCMSDTHGLHRELDVPEGDLLIYAGDVCPLSGERSAMVDFNSWLGELSYKFKCLVPGNHDHLPPGRPLRRSLLSNAVVLLNEGIEIEGLRIWGSAVASLEGGGAFGVESAEGRREVYSQIPAETDILITHEPPHGILDADFDSSWHFGCRELLEAVTRVRPKLHVFGHVHSGYGVFETKDTTFVNAALLGVHGELDRSPLVFKMTSK
jgi:Icc-related predicted phosphoesterase